MWAQQKRANDSGARCSELESQLDRLQAKALEEKSALCGVSLDSFSVAGPEEKPY